MNLAGTAPLNALNVQYGRSNSRSSTQQFACVGGNLHRDITEQSLLLLGKNPGGLKDGR